ncbi:MAG: AlwI family type II restriction endonuclease, partial [Betaproteobacteria bacterium]|nr:AlwI family type II restriction endonuclease [Betaproteobacteria bacterium]
ARKSTYKPLLFTTTVRNPERLRGFLRVLLAYGGKTLSDILTEEIAGEVIRLGLYKPSKLPENVKKKIKAGERLSDREVAAAIKNNPQKHKESGFGKGWPSRFDTWFKFPKELGFVFYRPGEKIEFSDIGRKYAQSDNPAFERQAFLNAFVKYQSNNPFRRVLNENAPLILLLRTISILNADKKSGGAGISKTELPLLIYWKDNDAEKLSQRILALRRGFGYSPSRETVADICRNEIMKGEDIKRDNQSIMVDYPDDFIRKTRLTGLISLRGGGRFVDINQNENQKTAYVLENYSDYKKYGTERDYFNYISAVDKNLFSRPAKIPSSSEKEKFLVKWAGCYTWEKIASEMLKLSGRGLTADDILKYLSNPVRLEFLTAMAIKSKFPDVKVVPNYPIDDEGVPTSTAGGNTGDIECFEGGNGILAEVTMLEGRAQTVAEVWPIGRHLEEFQKKAHNSMCYFVAPSIFPDFVKQINFLRKEDGLRLLPKTIPEFLNHMKKATVLYVNA